MNDGDYLKTNADICEDLFNFRFAYDIKRAAVGRGYHLQTYLTAVDRDGFDIILDDKDELRKVQLKTRSKTNSTTDEWAIQKQLLRPRTRDWEIFAAERVEQSW